MSYLLTCWYRIHDQFCSQTSGSDQNILTEEVLCSPSFYSQWSAWKKKLAALVHMSTTSYREKSLSAQTKPSVGGAKKKQKKNLKSLGQDKHPCAKHLYDYQADLSWPSRNPACVNIMVMEAEWHLGSSLCWHSSVKGTSPPQTPWPELTIWKLPCLKASIRGLPSVAAARKAKLWPMQFHAQQWSPQLNLYWLPHVKKAGKRQTRAATDQRQIEEKGVWATKMFHHARSNYWTPFAVLSLQINIFMPVWNYPWTSIALQYNEAHKTHSVNREAENKEAAFQHYQVLRRGLESQWQFNAVETCCPLKDTGHKTQTSVVHQGHL